MTQPTHDNDIKVHNHNLFSLAALAATAAALLLVTACGDAPGGGGLFPGSASNQCQQACGKLYDKCGFSVDNGTKSQCVSTCQGNIKTWGPVAKCITSAPCQISAMEQCASTSGTTGGQTTGSGGGCAGACKTIYQTCGLSFSDAQNGQISESQCASMCSSSGAGSSFSACVSKAKCDGNAILACVQ